MAAKKGNAKPSPSENVTSSGTVGSGDLKIHLALPAMQPGEAGWPFVDYWYEKRAREVCTELIRLLPQAQFDWTVFRSIPEAQGWIAKSADSYDGLAVYITTLWPDITQAFIRSGRPVIFADELYSGSGRLLSNCSILARDGGRAVGISSSRMSDFADALRLFGVMKKMRQSKILAVVDKDMWAMNLKLRGMAHEKYGVTVETIASKELLGLCGKVSAKDAKALAKKWACGAHRVSEPGMDELEKSARLHLALTREAARRGCNATTVDCLGLYYGKKLVGYPCLSFFEQNNCGMPGTCEADLESAITMLMASFLTGSPGYTSDPVVDTSKNQIIYAHCVSTSRPWGPKGKENPYIIRSHAEDGKGASVQSLLPLGALVTTVKVSLAHSAFSVHTAKAAENIDEPRACRTKLAAEFLSPGGAESYMRNNHYEIFNWHKVTCYGDWRRDFLRLAVLYGLKVYEEDRGPV